MTTLSPPLSSAVRVTLPLTPLPFCSTSFAFTVVSAVALTGTHSMAAAAVSTSELRNLAIRLIGPPRIRCLVCPGQLTTSTCGLKRCFQQTIWGNAELLSAGHGGRSRYPMGDRSTSLDPSFSHWLSASSDLASCARRCLRLTSSATTHLTRTALFQRRA